MTGTTRTAFAAALAVLILSLGQTLLAYEEELPGLKKDDVKVELNDNLLTISSDKEEKTEEKNRGYIMRERRSFSFRRSFRLPQDVRADDISADFTDGILTIEVPRTAKTQPKRIPIGKK